MKKIMVFVVSILLSFVLFSCEFDQDYQGVVFSDDTAFTIEIKGESLKILQVTDLHLTYGFDYNDRRTFQLIKNLEAQDDYDLIVLSGDLTMSPAAPRLYSQITRFMESLQVPWTFVFGNHDNDYHPYERLLDAIGDTDYLYFKTGPRFDPHHGVGNFRITFTKDNLPFYQVYFLDSGSELDGDYMYVTEAQVDWYETHVESDSVDSIMFMHIPLRQYIEADDYEGFFLEKRVYAQQLDTGMFTAMVHHGKTKALFVGHDHLNDFSFWKDEILLAYGRATGFNGYGTLEKGGRHIEILPNGDLVTYVMTESEVSP